MGSFWGSRPPMCKWLWRQCRGNGAQSFVESPETAGNSLANDVFLLKTNHEIHWNASNGGFKHQKHGNTDTQMVGITWYRHHRTIIYSIPNHAFYHEMDPILTNYWPQVWKNTCLGSNFHCPVPTRPCPHLASVNCGRALQRAGSTSPAEKILWISPKIVKLWVLSKKLNLTNQPKKVVPSVFASLVDK